jgi:hypothetical protein
MRSHFSIPHPGSRTLATQPGPKTASKAGAEAQAVEGRPPPVVFVEGFLVFANRELVELLDRRVLVVIGRVEARQRRLRTSGTTGLYFDLLIWPHCVDYSRQVLAAELQQPRQSEGGPGTDLLVLSGEDAMDENVRRLDAFVEGSGRLIGPMTEGAAKLVAQLRAGNDQGETDASPPTVRPSCVVSPCCRRVRVPLTSALVLRWRTQTVCRKNSEQP